MISQQALGRRALAAGLHGKSKVQHRAAAHVAPRRRHQVQRLAGAGQGALDVTAEELLLSAQNRQLAANLRQVGGGQSRRCIAFHQQARALASRTACASSRHDSTSSHAFIMQEFRPALHKIVGQQGKPSLQRRPVLVIEDGSPCVSP